MSCFITAYGLISALGEGVDASAEALLAWQAKGSTPLTRHNQALLDGRLTPVGRVEGELPAIPAALAPYASRNNQLLLAALAQIRPALDEALATFGPARVGLVLGTSTAGIGEAELAIAADRRGEAVPTAFDYRQQELGSPSEFLARHLGLEGPAYTLSTACSSSARAFISGQRMLAAGLVDAVLVGGADSLCGLTLNGFDSLESLSGALCQPFDNDRQGINIGEGAALFLLSRQPAPIALLGAGESSDAWHISAPHPDGVGAEAAMGMALAQAGLTPEQVGYINLHGTATRLNDAMESQAVYRLFGDRMPCSSTKPLTGHVLGAAGAIEAALACLLLERALPLPPQRVMTADPALAPIRLVSGTTPLATPRILSNSFAFGGNNVSLLFGRSAS
ncbi:beta-ketoacyl-[acyl-carrier-protein] synthase family protein [Aeromonas media]|uniref:Beta-ketoacyl-[acyl-carrier-protein] synthase family protein n=1 Tax=Aeromonas media TaxID=651 RepID=A0AAE7DQB4_AERME|nr:beta-ketoacyl-[acyl-carrier-protein] synthase family protein [Aeromonas media]MBS4641864.1 beta-ketoacyl-[acyl-carrier-protein] synthase family protein [Aeromonas media]MCV3287362.1 beta-ketoacyl-[acyl-carrier-protein] synthase family protein [Aeromonas media]QJT29597.1 beta-ketoacyl-[acyl-carrier-protein] synthase family protein [Aeromonas media]QJT35787.1 beta-ketoacyl-[acyl-carrier-protein] synthase family protein [Aeromonas media]QJT37614.1 beta-ketoacyl-[acyl-carrier-protein] synthase 